MNRIYDTIQCIEYYSPDKRGYFLLLITTVLIYLTIFRLFSVFFVNSFTILITGDSLFLERKEVE